MAELGALDLDFLKQIVDVHWQQEGCRFAVCGVGGYGPEEDSRGLGFGVGSYSDDGKTWTNFRDESGGWSIFHMNDPSDPTKNLLILGGNHNDGVGSAAICTALIKTIIGSGPNVSGGTSLGINNANVESIGYDKKKKLIYWVEFSGFDFDNPNVSKLHEFPLGIPDESPPSPDDEPSIFWAGPEYPGIGPVYRCVTPMTFKDKDGVNHTLDYGEGYPNHLLFDGKDITPPGARGIWSSAGGVNSEGETILIATGFHLIGTEDYAIAWWSNDEGKVWTEIEDIWADSAVRSQNAYMASAVPLV